MILLFLSLEENLTEIWQLFDGNNIMNYNCTFYIFTQ